MTFQELQEKYEEALSRVKELEREIARLKRVLQEHQITVDDVVTVPKPVPKRILSVEERVELFRSLFKGREDVFARRWFSKATGKSGYQPVCINEWNRQLCDKKKYKCAECPHRQFSPLTYDDIYKHLEGKNTNGEDVIGLYVLDEDNNCHLLCADFDDKNCEQGYQDDVLAFVGVCKSWNVPYSVERSRSGNGAHVWIFFETPVLAVKARRLGNAILTEAMNRDGRISFKSYDRFFPNQDTLPEGGLGNLVALPLQGKTRKEGNSVFVDENFEPYADQWEYLQHVEKLAETALEDILKRTANTLPLGELSKTSESKPWEVPGAPQITRMDFSSELTITRANMLYIPLRQLSSKVLNHLKRIASFRNPEFYSRQAMRFSTYSTPRIISCAEITDEYLALPRGCEDAVTSLLKEKGVTYQIEDKANHGKRISVHFNGTLRIEQQEAVDALACQNTGVLYATTAFGKTVAGIGLIAKHGVNTLILVHNNALRDQWVKRINEFLIIDDIPKEVPNKRGRKKTLSPVGTLSSSGNSLHGIIDIALLQSCVSDNEVKPFVRDYGMVIADECHHISAVSYEQVMKAVNARYVYGLTATPFRQDGHQPILFMQCGPIRYTADAKAQMKNQNFSRLLVPRYTPFRPVGDENLTYTKVEQYLVEDECRNLFIVKDIVEALKEGRSLIILTSRTSHVATLADLLQPHCPNVITLVGSESTKEKRQKMEQLQSIPPSEPLVIVATGKYVGEGFDYARLDTLFLASPIAGKNMVNQYTGRLHREFESKQDVQVYDYIDMRVPVCESMYRKRLKGYASIGYRIRNNEMFDSLFPTTDVIYDGHSFEPPFISDLAKTKHSAVISCPKINIGRHSRIAERLVDLAANGLDIVLYTKEDNDDTIRLKNQGISVMIKEHLSLHAAIIDKSIIWYGSVNILGFHSVEDNLIRFKNPEIATSLLESLR
ncbi:MAG: DEAD/DEAH box helicase family protein [Bacteroidaceae bacterium]|nr:DEAD/DEAH box helicase family protein [Bacteroidaceae bacterium]